MSARVTSPIEPVSPAGLMQLSAGFAPPLITETAIRLEIFDTLAGARRASPKSPRRRRPRRAVSARSWTRWLVWSCSPTQTASAMC